MNDESRPSHASGSGAASPGRALEKAVGFYEAVLGSMGEGLYTVNENGLVVAMNHAAERMLGWTQEELRGRKMHDAIHYLHRDGSAFPVEECAGIQVLTTGTPQYDLDDVFIRKDGSFFDVRYSSSPIVESGKTIGLVVVFRDVTERKVIENKLRESEERFSKFMQHLPGLAWIKDADGRYVFANAAAEVAFQSPMDGLVGKTDEEVFPPETAAAFAENDRLALESGSGRQAIETLEDEKGVQRYSLVSKFPIPMTDGQPPMIGGMAIDITDEKKAEQNHEFLFLIAEKIRLSRNADELLAEIAILLGKYLDIHRCLFNEIDLEADTEIVHNDYFRTGNSVAGTHKLSEYSPITSEIMTSGQTVINRDSKHDPRTADLFESTYGPNNELAYIAVPLLRDGRWVASLWCSDDKPRAWTDAEIGLLEGIADRVWSAVEKMRAEEAQARLAAIVESSDDAIIGKDLNGIITSWNRGAEKVFGYSAEEAIGHPVTMLMPPERVNEEPIILARIRRGESVDHYETVRRRKDGTRLDISLTVSPIREATGKIIGASKVARDITARKAAEDALRVSEERYRTLFDSMDEGYCIIEVIFDEGENPVDYRFIEVNSAFEKQSGMHDVVGKRMLEFVSEIEEHWLLNYGEVALTGVPVRFSGDYKGLNKSFEVYAFRVGEPDSHRVAVLFTDISERKAAAEALRASAEALELRVVERTQELAAANIALRDEINERKTTELQKIELLQRLVTSQEDQRQRIARDLHDQLGQRLTALRLKIASLREVVSHDENLSARTTRLQEISELLDSEVSFLAWELRPFALDELGLVDAIGTFVREWSKHYEIPAEFHTSGLTDVKLDTKVDSQLYRIAQEALNNIVKHAKAKSVNVLLEKTGNELILIVEDDGVGIDHGQDGRREKKW
jgi:PAS domain S-box-containing protein